MSATVAAALIRTLVASPQSKASAASAANSSAAGVAPGDEAVMTRRPRGGTGDAARGVPLPGADGTACPTGHTDVTVILTWTAYPRQPRINGPSPVTPGSDAAVISE